LTGSVFLLLLPQTVDGEDFLDPVVEGMVFRRNAPTSVGGIRMEEAEVEQHVMVGEGVAELCVGPNKGAAA
jgi:hypothetical protein